MPSSSKALMDATKKRAEKLQAKVKTVDFKELLRMEPESGTTNIRNVRASTGGDGCPPAKRSRLEATFSICLGIGIRQNAGRSVILEFEHMQNIRRVGVSVVTILPKWRQNLLPDQGELVAQERHQLGRRVDPGVRCREPRGISDIDCNGGLQMPDPYARSSS
jgi:hypothetical protein